MALLGKSQEAAFELEAAAGLCRLVGDLNCALDYEELARRGRGEDDLGGRTAPRTPPPPRLSSAAAVNLPQAVDS